MTRRTFLTLLGLSLLAATLITQPWAARAQSAGDVQWIWTSEGSLAEAPAGTRYFRRSFTINRPVPKPVDEAMLEITADNSFTVWVNGVEVGKGSRWEELYRFDVKKHLVFGANVIAVAATNDGGPAGLMVRLNYIPNGQTRLALVSDGEWKTASKPEDGWQKVGFVDLKWEKAKVLGAFGKVGPWRSGGSAQVTRGAERFSVPAGFKVEQAVKTPGNDLNFSLVNMTFDAKGRLLVSREGGPTLLCTDPDKNGICQTVRPYCEQVKNSQGMCWVDDVLLLVGNGPQGTGLYRCRDTKGADKIGEVKLLHRFVGGMGEHGPHAIIHGPDGWLYLVIGNHAWAKPDKLAGNSPLRRWPNGQMGPDQGKPGTTEDVLLPRLNDANGHAANILAPGGTIWRLDKNGQNMSLFSAGYRNQFDAAFSPSGELFTFDSDMEWDENLPWYRHVRICHATPGSDFVWRTGAANTPNYYIDSLPPLYETGRGSPVGVEFYDHSAFPARYRGACFLADWSIGAIWVLKPERSGATYKGKAEKFCTGAPMNVTDLAVGPDGALYFTLGGRGTAGGVFRIVHQGKEQPAQSAPQPLAAWSTVRKELGKANEADVAVMLKNEDAEVRARAIYLLGARPGADVRESLLAALKDADPLVRRRACEALIRAGIEPPVDAVWPLLSDPDKFLRTAARLVIQRIDPTKWAERIVKDADLPAWEGIVALCKENKASQYADITMRRLERNPPADGQPLLDYLRLVQLAAIHTGAKADAFKVIASHCARLFPHQDDRANRELAILLTHFGREKVLSEPVSAKLVAALLASKDTAQQVHYAYCLRLVKDGWTPSDKAALIDWYDSLKDFKGGHSLKPFLENIFRGILEVYSTEERRALLARAESRPMPALVLAQRLQVERSAELLPDLTNVLARLDKAPNVPRGTELRNAVTDAIVRIALGNPSASNLPHLVLGLSSPNKLVVGEVIDVLKKNSAKPKPDEPAPFRAAILAAQKLDVNQRWKTVELLRHWSNGRQFGAEDGEWKRELGNWAKWFAQTFPKEPALPDVAGDKPIESKYKYDELLSYLQADGKSGDAARGRLVFEKAQCIKCHKYGKEGEGIGPDLTTLSKRFKRSDVLESIYFPSRVISDQYRSTLFVTKKGQQVHGLAAIQGDQITVLPADGNKITLKKDDIEQQFASLVSAMPEKLLDMLERREIADLFAFLESEPAK